MLLIGFLEGFENIAGFPDFVDGFFNLTFEDFRGLKEGGGLKQNIDNVCNFYMSCNFHGSKNEKLTYFSSQRYDSMQRKT